MAEWPANGVENWNVLMKAYVDVGHDTDGTHNKSQMLTDMEWSPTAYTGGESVTLPNGLIIKIGEEACPSNSTVDVTYGTAFPTGFTWAMTCYKGADKASEQNAEVRPKSGEETTVLQVTCGTTARTLYWMAIGY